MRCEELLKALNDYVDGELDPAVCDDFQHHLDGCNPCQVVIDNIRRTIVLYKQGQRFEIPAPFRDGLHATLRARWKAKP